MNDYITVGDFETTTKVKSDLLGIYTSTKVCTIDFIKACEDKQLEKVVNYYSELTRQVRTYTLHSLERRWIVNQYLDKVELYVPLKKHNKDYVDPKRIYKKLPIGYTEKYIRKKLDDCKSS